MPDRNFSTGVPLWDMMIATNKKYVDFISETNKTLLGQNLLDQDRQPSLPMMRSLEASRYFFDLFADVNDAVMTTWMRRSPNTMMRRPDVTKQFNGKDEQVVAIGEEVLDVGVRKVTGETTRVRRFVKQVPVEQSVELHDETIVIERRPASGQNGEDALTEREYVMIDTREIPVVSKSQKVREELVLRKEVSGHVETVRETVLVSDVEVMQPQRMPVVTEHHRKEDRREKQQQHTH